MNQRNYYNNYKQLVHLQSFLEKCWAWNHFVYSKQKTFGKKPEKYSNPAQLSTAMCRYTSRFLLDVFKEAGDDSWQLAGGFIKNKNNPKEEEKHWWIENNNYIIDLTAAQFGWEPIVFIEKTDPRYTKKEELSHNTYISGLKTSVNQWKGISSVDWMDEHPDFLFIKKQYSVIIQNLKEYWIPEIAAKSKIKP